MQTEIVLPLATVVSETAAGDRLRRLSVPIAGAQWNRETIQDAQGLNILAGPIQQALAPGDKQIAHRLGTGGKAAVFGKMREEAGIRSPHLTQPSPLAFALAQLAD